MAFRFPLNSVLRVRDSIEQREELALLRVQFELARVRQRIENLTAEIDGQVKELDHVMRQPVAANLLQTMLGEIGAGMDARQSQLGSLATLEVEREKRMKGYQAARADRQMLSDMQSKQRTAYDREQTRIQQKFLDEIFTSRSVRS